MSQSEQDDNTYHSDKEGVEGTLAENEASSGLSRAEMFMRANDNTQSSRSIELHHTELCDRIVSFSAARERRKNNEITLNGKIGDCSRETRSLLPGNIKEYTKCAIISHQTIYLIVSFLRAFFLSLALRLSSAIETQEYSYYTH